MLHGTAAVRGRTSIEMDKYERFEAWLRENGAHFELLELREYDAPGPTKSVAAAINESASNEEKKDGLSLEEEPEESEMRGVHARMHIPPNTVCMTVPRKCLITVEMGQSTPLGQAILNSNLDLDAPKHIFLMIYLLWDRKVNGRRSFFYPYYEILPRTLHNMPIFWSNEELAYLQGSYLLAQISDRNEAIAEDYHAIVQVCPELEDLCTLEEFKWARMCVCSRNFGLQMDGHRTSALVPHADMLNHYRPRETKWTFDEERQAFTITTLQSIPAGAQVYDSYGQKCNHRFLLNYGFAVEDNRELDGFCPNEVPLELKVAVDDPLYVKKVEFWTRGETNSLVAAVAAVAARHQSVSAVHSAIEACVAAQRNRAMSCQGDGDCSTSPVKRIRVCVSNNENTRLLFSLLRALACNEDELNAILNPAEGGTAGGAPLSRSLTGSVGGSSDMNGGRVGDHHHHSLHQAHTSRSHLQASSASAQYSMATSTTPFYRSCRDIRHPISLRNERAAMHLLMDVCGSALHQYPTTLAQDIRDLMDEVAYPRFSNKRHAKIQVRGEKEVLHHFMQWAQTALHVLHVIDEELKTGDTDHGFDYVICEMEEEEHQTGGAGLHHTVVRYCADVLGSLRREEAKNRRRRERKPVSSAGSTSLSR